MKFILISFICFISLHYVSSLHNIYSSLFRPYHSYRSIQAHPMVRYSQPTAVRFALPTAVNYPQPTAVHYSVYRSFTPGNRNLVISKQHTDIGEAQSYLDNFLSNIKPTMIQMNQKQPSKTKDNPNNRIYKGKLTRKTSASNRSASV